MTKVWGWADSFRMHSVYFLSPVLLLVIWAWVCRAGIFPEQILVSPFGVILFVASVTIKNSRTNTAELGASAGLLDLLIM